MSTSRAMWRRNIVHLSGTLAADVTENSVTRDDRATLHATRRKHHIEQSSRAASQRVHEVAPIVITRRQTKPERLPGEGNAPFLSWREDRSDVAIHQEFSVDCR